MKDLNRFEKEIRQTYHLPEENPAFINRLEKKFRNDQTIDKPKTSSFFRKAKGWVYAMVTLLVLATLFFVIGPSKVLAQIQAILGFVPEVGIVDTSATFYQLAEPVSDSRDGITLSIQSAFLSADQTVISFTMTDLPDEIKRDNFGDPECNTPAHLTLPDGSKIQSSGYDISLLPDGTYEHTLGFEYPVTTNFNQAILTFPCLQGTIPGKGPEDWRFDLAFVPAPEDLTAFPVTLNEKSDITETERSNSEVSPQPGDEEEKLTMPAMIVDGDRQEEMKVLGVVEKPDSYWVTWAYPNTLDKDVQVNGFRYLSPFNPVFYDANGVELPLPDQAMRRQLWDYEDSLRRQLPEDDPLKLLGLFHTYVVPKTGVTFPIYIKHNVFERSFPEKQGYSDISFDGSLVQSANGPVEMNQEIQIGSTKFVLESIEKADSGGYKFNFNGAENKIAECQVELLGFPTNMAGNGNPDSGDFFNFYQSLMYSTPPTGELTVRVSQPVMIGDLISLIGSWSPDN